MPIREDLEHDDDYVAGLLKASAEKDQSRYLTSGLGALLSKQGRDSNAAKPNTRFLRQIIRQTDSHNAALKAKEEAESRTKLQSLGKKRERDGRWANAFSGLGAEKRDSKRKRNNDQTVSSAQKRRRGSDDRIAREAQHEREGRRNNSLIGLDRPDHERRRGEEVNYESDASHRHHKSRSSRHDKVPSREERHSRHGKEPRNQADHNPRRSPDRHSRSSEADEERTQRRKTASKDLHHLSDSDSDSNPQHSFIGPQPPFKSTHPRGRNANRTTNSAMDARFDPAYDPKVDIQASALSEGDGDDWDMALEALRDRVMWKKAGADRLKAAGFTEEEVIRWEKGGERGVEDVKWSEKGEGREWDRGKIVDDDGAIAMKPKWARATDIAD